MKEKDVGTEQAIMNAAEKVFIEKGYLAAKTTEIAKLAGINHAMLHYYFRTKENLFSIVFEKKVNLLANSFLSIIDDDMPFLEKISKGIEAHFNFITQNPGLPFFIFNEIRSNEKHGGIWQKLAYPVFSKVLKKLQTLINAEVSKGAIRPINPIDLVVNIMSLNVFIFVSEPMVSILSNTPKNKFGDFLEHRKKENVRLILLSLQP